MGIVKDVADEKAVFDTEVLNSTDKLKQAILACCGELQFNGNLNEIGKMVGVSLKQIKNWKENDPEFCEGLKDMEDELLENLKAEVYRQGRYLEGKGLNAAMFLLKKKDPEFAEVSTLKLEGSVLVGGFKGRSPEDLEYFSENGMFPEEQKKLGAGKGVVEMKPKANLKDQWEKTSGSGKCSPRKKPASKRQG